MNEYVVELIEYGYQKVLFSVEARNSAQARRKVERYDPIFNEEPGVSMIEADFEVTGSEVTSVDRVRRPE